MDITTIYKIILKLIDKGDIRELLRYPKSVILNALEYKDDNIIEITHYQESKNKYKRYKQYKESLHPNNPLGWKMNT